MEEEQKDQEQQAPDPKDEQEQAPEKGKADPPGPVPYDRFSEVTRKLRAAEAKLKKLEDAQKAADDAKLKEQGDYKTLLEQRETELKTLRWQSERMRVAMAKGLPAELADRLQGETAVELEADADKLLALVKSTPANTPGVPPPSGGAAVTAADLSKMTPQEIREWSEKHGWGRR